MPPDPIIDKESDEIQEDYVWGLKVGWWLGNLEGYFVLDSSFRGTYMDDGARQKADELRSTSLTELLSLLSAKGIRLHNEAPTFQEMANALRNDILAMGSEPIYSYFLVGWACVEVFVSGQPWAINFRSYLLEVARSNIEAIPGQSTEAKNKLYDDLARSSISNVDQLGNYLAQLAGKDETGEQKEGALKNDVKRPSSTAVAPQEEEQETYVDFDLQISANGHVVARSPQGEATDDIPTNIPTDIQSAVKSIGIRQIAPELLEKTGASLYKWLFPGPIHAHLLATEAVARHDMANLRLRMRIEAPEIASLPLEFLYRETGGYFMAVNPGTVLSRYLDLPLPPGRGRRREGPLHLLVIIASPVDQPPLDPDEWEGIMRTALASPLAEGKMTLKVVKKATRIEIRNALLAKKPDIIQFVGHGVYSNGKGSLALVDEKQGGKTWLVDDERFANLFMGYDENLGLIGLATCESAKSDDPQGFSGIAPQLVQRGAPAVVAMQYKVYVDTAKVFLEDFYTSVAARKPLDWAVQSARNAISLEFGLDNREFATPVLYMRAQDGKVF